MRVIVDEREKPSGVPQELEGLDMMVNYRVLDVADYLVQDYAIERKSVRDFVSSLFNGRLFDQAYRLEEAFQTPIMVVEGDLDREMQGLKNPRSIWGGLISIVLDFGLACFFTKDQKQTAQFILTLAKGHRYKGLGLDRLEFANQELRMFTELNGRSLSRFPQSDLIWQNSYSQ